MTDHSVESVRAIYDKAYANPGLMGTQLDVEYSRVTKQALLEMCASAPNSRLLDMGTGDGDLWQYVPPGVEAHAVDISWTGVQRAHDRFPSLHAAVAIAEHLPYPTGFFGSAIAADTLEHVFDVEAALAEVKRVLSPGGKFALSLPTPDSLRKWAINRFWRQTPSLRMFARLAWVVARRQQLFGRAAFQPIDRDWELDDWRRVLVGAGFTLEHMVEWPPAPFTPIVYLVGAAR